MSQLPAMPMWWGDFFSKTDHLNNAEQWAYAKLLAKTWLRNCRPLPDNDRDMARLLNLSALAWRKIRARIAPFFDLSEGTWRQTHLENEFKFVSERATNARTNGRKGGRPKSIDNNSMENPAGSIWLTQNEPNPKAPTPILRSKEDKKGSVGLRKPTAATGAAPPSLVVVAGSEHTPDPKRELYTLGKQVLGKNAGGQITKLLTIHDGDIAAAAYTMRQVAQAAYPAEYLGKILSRESLAPTDYDAMYRRMGVRPDGSSFGDQTYVPLLERPGDDGKGNLVAVR